MAARATSRAASRPAMTTTCSSEQLGRLLDESDPVPDELVAFAAASLTWRTVGSELAELLFDSAQEDTVAVRAAEGARPVGPRGHVPAELRRGRPRHRARGRRRATRGHRTPRGPLPGRGPVAGWRRRRRRHRRRRHVRARRVPVMAHCASRCSPARRLIRRGRVPSSSPPGSIGADVSRDAQATPAADRRRDRHRGG